MCLVTMLLLVFSLFGTWVPFRNGNESIDYDVITSNNGKVTFEISTNGMYSTDKTVGNEIFQRISLPEGMSNRPVGSPELPYIRKLIAIPECSDFELTVNSFNISIYNGYNIYPVPIFNSVTSPNGTTFKEEVFTKDIVQYNINDYLLSSVAVVGEVGYFRDQKFAEILIYPINYNPVTKEINIRNDINLTLTFANSSGSVNVNTGIFNSVASSTMINYASNGINALVNDHTDRIGQVSKEILSSEGEAELVNADYVIISDNIFYDSSIQATNPNESTNPSLQALAQHRASYNGFSVSIVDVENIMDVFEIANESCSRERAIRRFITRVYTGHNAPHTQDGHLAYVLLVGDVVMDDNSLGVDTSYDHAYLEEDWFGDYTVIASDTYYTLVSGNDSNSDLMIGRFGVSNATELDNLTQKTIFYETEYNPDENWRESTCLSYRQIYDGDMNVCNTYVSNMLNILNEPYLSNFDSYCYDIDPDLSLAIADINSGNIFTGIAAHGSPTSISLYGQDGQSYTSSDFVEDLSNNHKTPNIIFSSCLVGAMDFSWQGVTDCLSEKLLNFDDENGFVTSIGASRAIVLHEPINLQNSLYEAFPYNVWHRHQFVAGEAWLTAKNMNYEISDNYNMNFFGDPALNIMAQGFKISESIVMSGNTTISSDIEVEAGAILTLSSSAVVSLEQNGRIIVNEGAILNVNDGAIINLGYNNSIEIFGQIMITSNPNTPPQLSAISGYDYDPGSLNIHDCSATNPLLIDNVSFNNIILRSWRDNLTIEQCSFVNGASKIKGNHTSINNSTFAFSPVNIMCNGCKTFESSVIGNQFTSSTLEIESNTAYTIHNNSFTNENLFPYINAINIYNSGIGGTHEISDNNIGVFNDYPFAIGIDVYQSHADIIGLNVFHNTQYAIRALNNSKVKVTGNPDAGYYTETQQFNLDCSPRCAIYADHISFPYEMRWNYLGANSFTTEQWLTCNQLHTALMRPHCATNNNWNSCFIANNNIDLNKFTIDPIWELDVFPLEVREVEQMYNAAIESKETGNLAQAETQFKYIIENYPDTNWAEASLKELLSISKALYTNMSNLKTYYSDQDIFSTPELERIAGCYSILCDIADKNYSAAISAYEDIISNPPSPEESLYATIDLGYTYILMNSDSTKTNISYKYPDLRPKSYDEFKMNRENLLNQLMGYEDTTTPDSNVADIEINAYPNPFNPNVTFSVRAKSDVSAELTIFNVKGQTVKKLADQTLKKGINNIVWQGDDNHGEKISSGIYLYKIEINGKCKSGKLSLVK